eukprot:m.43415 g.43415  ORF g.43415 m.43415 type:complete len:78 (+) comp12923_c0_seq1:973-1206(+)
MSTSAQERFNTQMALRKWQSRAKRVQEHRRLVFNSHDITFGNDFWKRLYSSSSSSLSSSILALAYASASAKSSFGTC